MKKFDRKQFIVREYNKSQEFIDIIKSVADGLYFESIHYDSGYCSTSIMGLVAQAALKMTRKELNDYLSTNGTYDKWNSTEGFYGWAGWIQLGAWPINQRPAAEVFILLERKGFIRDDICSIPKMSDEYILECAGLNHNLIEKYKTEIRTKKIPKYKTIREVLKVTRDTWWGRLWNIKDSILVENTIFDKYVEEEVEVRISDGTERIGISCERNRRNYWKYLSTWVKIMEEENEQRSSKHN